MVLDAGQDGVNVNGGNRNRILRNTILDSSDDTPGRDGIRVGASGSLVCDDT